MAQEPDPHDCSGHKQCIRTAMIGQHHECYCLPGICSCPCMACNPQTKPGPALKLLDTRFEIRTASEPFDPVNRPKHYADSKIEVIDYIEDKQLGFHLGNAVKYISRAGKKDPTKVVEDLEKARWYLDRYIQSLKQKPD